MLFQIVWPGSAALIWLSIIRMLLHRRTTTLDATGLKLVNRIGPIQNTQVFEKSQILGFRHDTNMSSNNTNFYRVRLEDMLGKKSTIVDNITESTTAEVLARHLNAWKHS